MGSTSAGRKLVDLLNQADRWLAEGNVDKAVGIYEAVIDQTVPIMEQVDDSDGELSECLTRANEGLMNSLERLSKTERDDLLAYCLDRLRKVEFREWRINFLTFASDLAQTAEQRALVTSALDDFEADAKRSASLLLGTFELEQIVLLRHVMIKRFDGEAASTSFLQAHIHFHDIRMLLIQKYIDEGEIDEAIRQVEAGIAAIKDPMDRHLIFRYKSLVVDAMIWGDKPAVVSATRWLWLENGTAELFALLKINVPTAEWATFVDGLVKDLHDKPEQLAWLYAEENR